MAASSTHVSRYDVFISFRGDDTRNTFTSHLFKALDRKKINTYLDYELESGDEIGPTLLKAIEESKISVIIFSENYATSTWCLDELVHILECKKINQQFVIPVFYRIDPSHVRHQREGYATAFAKHEERFKDRMDQVLKWKGALTTAANLSGFDSHTICNESELVERVVEAIFMKLDRELSSHLANFIGVESRIQKIKTLLCIVPPDVCVRTVGIWGMGGIGKTTLADAVFSQLSSQFEASCFLANIREESERRGLRHLRNELLGELLKEENFSIGTPSIGSAVIKNRLSRAKILIVLDDVNDLSQLESLVGDQVQFGSGSRIIITTRDMQLLREMQLLRKSANHDVQIYKVEELDNDEALQLFHLNDSEAIRSGEACTELVRMVLHYAAGIPLALKILGSLFRRCKSKQEREDFLKKLKKFPEKKLQNVYRVSYDALGENEREMFLYIACFHKGEKICSAKAQLDACGLFAGSGIEVLIDMSLISIKDDRYLWMHDVIQEMGWAIEREKYPEKPGKRSRLCAPEDVCHVLERNKGTEKVQSISLNLSMITELKLTPQAFKKMGNLKFLKFCGHDDLVDYSPLKDCDMRLNLQDLESLPDTLIYLRWPLYPLKSLPSKFSSDNLVELNMPGSQLRRLWNEGQNPRNLKRIDLHDSTQLVEVPDLSVSVNIESINLEGCIGLVEVPSYFENLHKLTSLNLSNCLNLRFLSDMPRNLVLLELQSTAIEELPSSIWSHEKLVELNLDLCEGIKNLPNSTWKLNSLTSLYLSGTSIEGLPSSIESLSAVVSIELIDCKRFVSLPTSICKLKSLQRLSLNGSSSFNTFPEILEPMYCLVSLNLGKTEVNELPSSIENLVGLKRLWLSECKSLESVPNSIYNLKLLEDFKVDGCCKLKKLPPSSFLLCSFMHVNILDLRGCKVLEEIPDCISSLTSLNLSGSMIKSIPSTIKQASRLRFLYARNCNCLQSLPELPSLLKVFDTSGCPKLKTVSFSMTALRQGLDQICEDVIDHYEKHRFYNCLNLDENSRSNIMDDAHLRIMRIATANYRKFLEEGSPLVGVVCSGSKIPKWFSYQTEGCLLNIELPINWSEDPNFLGLALCAVVTSPEKSSLRCKSDFKTINGESHQFNNYFPYDCNLTRWGDVNSDHVLVWYYGLESAQQFTIFNNATEASFEFYALNKRYVDGVLFTDDYMVKRCGVSLLYAQD
ncbi:disease resistance protein RPV1-like [Rosa rugosa]|uniref:disease resistance protein RPV1-like n=1 Tax=Rosa rugosa TaxID=74645 RepID=UPI002B413B5F|nr:disease resistance protein RPV1-like [Rosa rugosa]